MHYEHFYQNAASLKSDYLCVVCDCERGTRVAILNYFILEIDFLRST